MGKTTMHILRVLWRFEDLLCWIAWGCSLSLTVASLLGVLKRTSHRSEWIVVFWMMGLEIMLSFLIGLLQKYIVSHMPFHVLQSPDTLRLFCRYRTIDKYHIEHLPFSLFVFNLLFAIVVWGGSGHDIGGTWQFTAGAIPGFIALLNALFSHELQIQVNAVVEYRLRSGV